MKLVSLTNYPLAVAWMLAFLGALATNGQTPIAVSSITSSADRTSLPLAAMDGDRTTHWSADGKGQWLGLDLGSFHLISTVDIAWLKGDQRTASFEILTSQTGSEWISAFKGISSGTSLNYESTPVLKVNARYVRIVGYGNSQNDWNSICEVKITGIDSTNEISLPITWVTASSSDGNGPSNTLDGNLDTRWSAKGAGQWILYSLGVTQIVTSIDIAWYRGDQRVAKFEILTGNDRPHWTRVYSGTSSGKTLAPETYAIEETAARYISIVGEGNTENEWTSIAEVAIYGHGSVEATPPPKPGGLPSSILDLTNWKLTLPVNTSHPGNPDEILQPELEGFQNAASFYVTPQKNGVVFRAGCGGVTTSGSGYPRSELREMTNSGQDLASWSTTAGTHTMIITQAITHLPVVKPHMVAGQIHNAKDDVLVFRLEGQTLFIDENGKTGSILTTQYKLGDIFTAAFIARDGAVECYYNGNYIYSYPIKSDGCYFKAGCYTQSNLHRGDGPAAYGEVIIYGLSVTHRQ